jgi:Family of unknown function (DUF6364)
MGSGMNSFVVSMSWKFGELRTVWGCGRVAGTRIRRTSKKPFALIKGSTYYGYVNITLSLDEQVVKQARKIAIERDTTLTGLVRSYLEELAAEHAKSGRKRRELDALERSFQEFQFDLGKRTWSREDLHDRR